MVEIRGAITDLADRGVISLETAWVTRSAEPGMLAMRMRSGDGLVGGVVPPI